MTAVKNNNLTERGSGSHLWQVAVSGAAPADNLDCEIPLPVNAVILLSISLLNQEWTVDGKEISSVWSASSLLLSW